MTERAYRDGRGRALVLGAELGGGGEGSVFIIRGRPDLCAKIYRPEKAATRAAKVEAMIVRAPAWPLRRALAWPVATLHTDDGAFAGFVMPALRGALELFRLIVPDERMQVAGWLTQHDLFVIAARLAKVVAGVHRAGHCVGDLKPQNILIVPTARRVVLIDADSFQICDPRRATLARSLVVTPEYAAPELLGRDPASVDRTPASDAFALAVLIHQILLGGAHPFEGELVSSRGGASVERIPGRIRRGLCPRVPGVAGIRPPAGALPFELLPEELRALFVRCFGVGLARPAERPGAGEWARALRRAGAAMAACPVSHVHTYAAGLARCPWCERKARTGIDLFVAGQGWQRAIAGRSTEQEPSEALRLRWLRRHVRGRGVDGTVTQAERAWLEKTGAALGFGRERVARVIAEPEPGAWWMWLRRRRIAVAAAPEPGRARVARVDGEPETGAWWTRRTRRRIAAAAALLLIVAGLKHASTDEPPAERRAAAAQEQLTAALGRAQWGEIGRTRGGVFLRAAPSRASERRRLSVGTAVRLTGRTRAADGLDWTEVEVPGHTGWVATRYVVIRDGLDP